MGRQQNEENTKVKLVLPLLKQGLGYSNDELNFEQPVRNRRADIAITVNNKTCAFIEVKKEKGNLNRHIDQAVEYGLEQQIEFVALTNGQEFRIYATFAKGVIAPSDRLIESFNINQPTDPPKNLYDLFSRTSCPDFNKLKKLKEKLRPKATESDLTNILRRSTDDLFNILSPQFTERYKSDLKFKGKIDLWARNVKLDINNTKLIENLCKEGAYSLINRVLFYCICEDRSSKVSNISDASLKNWRKDWRNRVEKPSIKLGTLFDNSTNQHGFAQFYNSPLFNSIKFNDVEWDQNVILRVLGRFANINFKSVNNDLIGKAYEKHIPESERKNLGQFYTPQFIVEYLVDQIDFTAQSRVLDPACGSGAFLTRALDQLIEKTNISPNSAIENNLYGIDINPFANQLTTMNLLLKTLNCTKKPKHINVLSADSLIDKITPVNLFSSDELGAEAKKNVKEINKFLNPGNTKFDVIVGNPPYLCFGLRGNPAMKKIYKNYLKNRWTNSAEYKISYYPLFIERSIKLLSEGGIMAFILPDSFLVGKYFSKIRKHILDTCKIQEIVLCKEDFWEDGEVGCPTLLMLQKESDTIKRKDNQVIVKLAESGDHIKTKNFKKYKLSQNIFQNTSCNRFELYFDSHSKQLVETMRSKAKGTMIKDVVLGYSGAIAAKGYKKQDIIAKKEINSYYKKGLLDGNEVLPYKVNYKGGWIKIQPRVLRSGYNPTIMQKTKILIRQTADTLIAAIDKRQLYHLNKIHTFHPIDQQNAPLEWIALIINSSIMNRFYHIISMEVGRAMAQTDIDQLQELPFIEPSVDMKKKAEKLYKTLSTQSQNTPFYQNAKNEAERLVANTYGINQKLQDIATKTVQAKQLASVSRIQEQREISRRTREKEYERINKPKRKRNKKIQVN